MADMRGQQLLMQLMLNFEAFKASGTFERILTP